MKKKAYSLPIFARRFFICVLWSCSILALFSSHRWESSDEMFAFPICIIIIIITIVELRRRHCLSHQRIFSHSTRAFWRLILVQYFVIIMRVRSRTTCLSLFSSAKVWNGSQELSDSKLSCFDLVFRCPYFFYFIFLKQPERTKTGALLIAWKYLIWNRKRLRKPARTQWMCEFFSILTVVIICSVQSLTSMCVPIINYS